MGDERDNVKLGSFDGSDLKEYVKGQCEIMEDAGRHIEMIMEELILNCMKMHRII